MHQRAFWVPCRLLEVGLSCVGGSVAAQEGLEVAGIANLSATVDHPLVPLAAVSAKVFTGEDLDTSGNRMAIRTEERVVPGPQQVAGIAVTVVSVEEYHDGELAERSADYFAQGTDGTVHVIGEQVTFIADGTIPSSDGSWLTGDQGVQPGVFMPPDPVMGQTFTQEDLPDVAIEQSIVIAVEQSVTTAAGDFDGCVVTHDSELPLGIVEEKTYCAGVGLVREETLGGYLELVQFETTS